MIRDARDTRSKARQAVSSAPNEAPLAIAPPSSKLQAVRPHKCEWAVDRIAPLLSAPEYQAAERLRWAFHSKGGRARIGDYGSGAGTRSDPANRLPITPTQERAAREFEMVWNAYEMDNAVRAILWNFVLEQAPSGCPRTLTGEEFGRLFGGTSDARRAKGVADGALKTALGVLESEWRKYDRWWREQMARTSETAARQDRKRMNATDVRDTSRPSGSLWGKQWLPE